MINQFVRGLSSNIRKGLDASLTSRLYWLFTGWYSAISSGIIGGISGALFGGTAGIITGIVLAPLSYAVWFAIAIEVQKKATSAQIAISINSADMAISHLQGYISQLSYTTLSFYFFLSDDREMRLVELQTVRGPILGDLQNFLLGDSHPSDLIALDVESLRDDYEVYSQPRTIFRPGEPLVVPVIISPSVRDGAGMKYRISVETRGRFADLRRGNPQIIRLPSLGPTRRITVQCALPRKERRRPLVTPLGISGNESFEICGRTKDLSSGTVIYEWEFRSDEDLPSGERKLQVMLARGD